MYGDWMLGIDPKTYSSLTVACCSVGTPAGADSISIAAVNITNAIKYMFFIINLPPRA